MARRGQKRRLDLEASHFPKGSDLSIHTAEDLRAVAYRLNHLPLDPRLANTRRTVPRGPAIMTRPGCDDRWNPP